MYPKLQSKGIANGDNTGSCAGYVYYLCHENNWKRDNGRSKEQIPFFDGDAQSVTRQAVIDSINSNKKGLHTKDVKFFSLIISPSDKEIARLGDNRSEQMAALHTLVGKMMDRYAEGFQRAEIKSHSNLLYYYTIHEYRTDGEQTKPGLHVHIIISRKNKDGKYKLSPMTNHRRDSGGIIKSGFDRDAFYKDCERIFDTSFNYERHISESYIYLNTLKHGTNDEKTKMIRAAVLEDEFRESITRAFARRAVRLAKEAEAQEKKTEQAQLEAYKRKRDKFWNTYHSHYRPIIDEMNQLCEATFSIYSEVKLRKSPITDMIDARFEDLKNDYSFIAERKKEIANTCNYEQLLFAFAKIMLKEDRVLSLIVFILLLILLSIREERERASVHHMQYRINQISERIEELIGTRKELVIEGQEALCQYIQAKNKKWELKKYLENLKEELDRPMAQRANLGTMAPVPENPKLAKEEQRPDSFYHHFGVYGMLMKAETIRELKLDLLTKNTLIEPVLHANGGVADLRIKSEDCILLASKKYPDEKFASMLNKWCSLTGDVPAYKVKDTSKPGRTSLTHSAQSTDSSKQTKKSQYPPKSPGKGPKL